LLTGVLVWRLGAVIADLLGVPALAGYLWLLPVGVLLSGAYQVFNYWAVRIRRFTTNAIQTPEFPPDGMQRCEN
jgi:hypothetical protein